MSAGENEDECFVVKVRGLPWSTTVDEILKFFSKLLLSFFLTLNKREYFYFKIDIVFFNVGL